MFLFFRTWKPWSQGVLEVPRTLRHSSKLPKSIQGMQVTKTVPGTSVDTEWYRVDPQLNMAPWGFVVFFLIDVLDFYHGSLLNHLNNQTCTHKISLARWRQHAGKLAYKQPHLKYMMIKWMIPRQGWTWYWLIFVECWHEFQSTKFGCWILLDHQKCLKNSQIQAKVHKDITIAWKIRRIDGNGSVFALLGTEKLVDHMVFPIYIRARRSLHTLLVIQPPIIWINEKALKILDRPRLITK